MRTALVGASLAGLLVACGSHQDDTSVLLGEDPDALGGEPPEFEPYVAGRPITAFAPYAGVPRLLTEAYAPAELSLGAKVQAYRSFKQGDQLLLLVLDLESLRTNVVSAAWLEAHSIETTGEGTRRAHVDGRTRARGLPLNSVTAAGQAGLTRAALTVDMCQSSKPWERAFFQWVVAEGRRRGEPLELNVAMTGIWAKSHPAEFAQLTTWRKQGDIRITWVNHSFRHPLHCSGRSCAFLTHPSENINSAVLLEEQDLLSRGEIPSLFFRFPGLTHDERTLSGVSALGLYTLDGDAWLAKGQSIHDGAVILVHGNGNEPEGIRRFFSAVNGAWASPLADKRLHFVSMNDL